MTIEFIILLSTVGFLKISRDRRTRHAGHCWRSRDELIRDVLLWIPTHGRAKAGRPARTYIQQLCEDTGCCPEDLPRTMNDREEWRERVRDIRATSTIWWWWWYIYIYLERERGGRERGPSDEMPKVQDWGCKVRDCSFQLHSNIYFRTKKKKLGKTRTLSSARLFSKEGFDFK